MKSTKLARIKFTDKQKQLKVPEWVLQPVAIDSKMKEIYQNWKRFVFQVHHFDRLFRGQNNSAFRK